MGGSGSGRRCRYNKQTTVDEVKHLDVRLLKRLGFLRPNYQGVINWTRGDRPAGEVGYTCFEDRLILNYRYSENGGDWESVQQVIWFNSTPCNYGGTRKWFLCPGCQKRVAILCGGGKLFLCRSCYQLPYASQNSNEFDYLIEKKHELGRRIFEHYEYGEGWGKKKGMHWKKYQKLYDKYLELERKVIAAVRIPGRF